jgi:hypothetical protein
MTFRVGLEVNQGWAHESGMVGIAGRGPEPTQGIQRVFDPDPCFCRKKTLLVLMAMKSVLNF